MLCLLPGEALHATYAPHAQTGLMPGVGLSNYICFCSTSYRQCCCAVKPAAPTRSHAPLSLSTL